MPARRKAALQPWAGLELGPKELAGQRRAAAVAALGAILARDQDFLKHVTNLHASLWSSPTLDPKLLDQVAAVYVRRAGYARAVMAHVLAQSAYRSFLDNGFGPARPTRPQWVLSLATVAVFVDEDLTDEDPRHWPHAKRWHEAGLVLAAVGAGACPHLVERGGRLEACRTVPGRLGEDGRQRRYCSRHQPQTKFEKSSDRADREAVTNLLHAAGEALGVPRARNTAAA